jgi:hypothetical protein
VATTAESNKEFALRRLALTTIMILLAIPAGAAHAKMFPSVAVDGPADITEAGDIDLAPDGTGGIGYAKRESGVAHAYVARFVGGQFVGRDRVDPGLEGGSSQVVVGAANNGRLSVFFVSGGVLYANIRPYAGANWTGPQGIAVGATNPVVDMSINGTGFAAYTVGGQVFSAYVDRRSNTYSITPAPLNIDPSENAGTGTDRPHIAVSAAGSGVVVWGEDGADARTHIYARRVFQGAISTAPQEVSVPSFEGRPAMDADLPDVDIEDDASFVWVAFREFFNDGGTTRSRMLVRHLRGATFDDALSGDLVGWSQGVNEPHIDLNTRGEGMATVTGAVDGAAITSTLKDQLFRPGNLVGAGSDQPEAMSTTAYGYDRVVAYTEGIPAVVKGRTYDDSNRKRTLPLPSQPIGLTSSQFGPVDTSRGFDLSGDTDGDALVLFTQGAPGAQTVVAAGNDLPPGKATALSKWTKSRKRPFITWKSKGDAWGPITFRVFIAGKAVGATTGLKFTAKKTLKLGKKYKLKVIATDVRGQTVSSSTVNLAVDSKAPTAHVKFKRSGKKVTVSTSAADGGTKKRPASGIASIKITWGDGSTKAGGKGSHKYKSGGKKKVRVTVTDKAGNHRTVSKRV